MLRRNLIANAMGQACAAVMALAFIPVYVRTLGMEGYGVVGLYSALYAVLGIVDGSIQALLARSAAQARAEGRLEVLADRLRTLEQILAVLGLVIFGTMTVAAQGIGHVWLKREALGADTVAFALSAMGLLLALRLFEGLYRACLMGLERQVVFNVIFVIGQVLRWAGAAAVLTWFSPSVDAFFLWQAGVAALSVLALAVLTYRAVGVMGRGRWQWRALWLERRFIGGVMVISIAAVLLVQTDKLLLSHLLPLTQFGDYALAATAAGAFMLLAMPIADAVFPRLVRSHAANDLAAFTSDFHLGAQLIAVLLGSAACTAIAFAPWLLELWTGDGALAQRTARLFRILLLGNLLNALMWMPYRSQLAVGWTALSAKINWVAVLCLVPAIFVFAPGYGAEGAAWILVLLNAAYLTLGVHFMFKQILTGEKWRWYRDDVAKPVLAATLPVIFVAVFMSDTVGALARIGLCVVAGALSMFFAFFASAQLSQVVCAGFFVRSYKKTALRPTNETE